MKKIRYVFFAILMSFSLYCFAESAGEKAFKENKPEEAVLLLEDEINAGTAAPVSYNYLGLSYYQLGEYEKSIEAFGKGLSVSGTNKKLLAYNQGNSYFSIQKFDDAVKSFTLALKADSTFYTALLNRANAYLMADALGDALTDYKKYIIVVPDDPQRPEIERLIDALSLEMDRREEEARLAAIEAERLAEEERLLAEEMERQRIEEEKRLEQERLTRAEQEKIEREAREAREAEERRLEQERLAAEAERRRKLLEEVANSLHNTDSTSMSSGAEDLIDYEQEAELD